MTNFIPNEFIVKAQKASTPGFLYWDSSGVTVSDKKISPDQVRGFSVSDGAGSIITAWDDDRKNNVETDIYIQRVYADGRVGGDTITSLNDDKARLPDDFKLELYSNPFNNRLHIAFDLKRLQFIELSVYNVGGERIWSISKQRFKSGRQSLVWDGRNQNGTKISSGVYLITIYGDNLRLSRKVVLLK